ncbi:flavin reductase [Micrococcales bacterium 31B]|nr:flavin reductase [Micrococcales bacterium 31B]
MSEELNQAPTVSPEVYKAAFRNHPAGVAVITTQTPNGPAGLTASSVFSASATPPIVVFSISAHSSSGPAINASESVVVHLMGADQVDIAKTFATSNIDRFADTSMWRTLPTGEPCIIAAPVWLRGRIISRMPAGEAVIVGVEILEASVQDDVMEGPGPLVYHNRAFHQLTEDSKLT